MYVRIKPYGAPAYSNQYFDIPIESAESMREFIKWANAKKIDNAATKSTSFVFKPLPGVDYWIRRSLPSGKWEDGTPGHRGDDRGVVGVLDATNFLKALEAAINESKKF